MQTIWQTVLMLIRLFLKEQSDHNSTSRLCNVIFLANTEVHIKRFNHGF